MNESILLAIQREVTDILDAENPDPEIKIFSRTKGDIESDIEANLAVLAQAVSVLETEIESVSANVASCVSIKEASITIQTISGVALQAAYDAHRLAEWVIGVLHHARLETQKAQLFFDTLQTYRVSDSDGNLIDGAKGVSVKFKILNLSIPKIARV